MRTTGFAKKLLAWHAAIERPMPWKGEKNPYLIWLSEIILQQTSVKQGWAYYLKFKERFPDVETLAQASEGEVLRLWQGLGYNTRARNLHAAAKYVQQELGGIFPTDYQGIRNLKGVGDYTAAAIASFAFNLPYAVVDANVLRILSRYFGIKTAIDSTKGKQQFALLAGQQLPKREAARFNQAIMDFGAMQCVPKKPACRVCPLCSSCVARKKKMVERLPVKSKKMKQRERFFHYLVIREGEFTYLQKRVMKDIWQNMFEFPMVEAPGRAPAEELISPETGQRFLPQKDCAITGVVSLRQTLSHQIIHGIFYEVEIKKQMKRGKQWMRIRRDEIQNYPLSGIVRAYLKRSGKIGAGAYSCGN